MEKMNEANHIFACDSFPDRIFQLTSDCLREKTDCSVHLMEKLALVSLEGIVF